MADVRQADPPYYQAMKLTLTSFSLIVLLTAKALLAQTGAAIPALTGLDRTMNTLLQKYNIPGGALAVSQNGRLIYARGFGVAEKTKRTPVQPDSLFRVGSVSKPITVVTALRLVQDGKMGLDAPIVPLLGTSVLAANQISDARWNQITVRHLMQHSGGWDSEATFDPLVSYAVIEGLGLSLPLRAPLTRDQVIRFMAAKPLQFAPGSRFAYSNFGLMILGRVMERVTGKAYEQLVRETTLEPMGIQRMAVGKALTSERKLGEVDYFDELVLPAVYPGIGENVPAPDGGYYFELIEAAGAWIASPIDLVRFADGVDGRRGTALLNTAMRTQMVAKPSYFGNDGHYGLGWIIEPVTGGGADWLHNGALEGNFAFLYRSEAGGISFAATFNAYPQDDNFQTELLDGIGGVLLTARTLPQTDEYETYLPALAPRVTGVVDAASQQTGVAAGGLVTLYGLNLGPAMPVGTALDAGGRVTTSLGGVEVRFDGIPAPLLYVSRNQINAVMPFLLAGKTETTLEVTYGGRTARVTSAAGNAKPGLFTLSGNGRGAVVAVSGTTLNGEGSPAARGSVVTLWASGLGGFETQLRDGEVPRTANPLRQLPRVTVDSQLAELLYAGTAPGLVAGVVQINLRIPANARTGRVFVELTSDNANGRDGVWLWVRN